MMFMLVVLYVTVRFSAELGTRGREGGGERKREKHAVKPNYRELLIILYAKHAAVKKELEKGRGEEGGNMGITCSKT